MAAVERAARSLLADHGVHLDAVALPAGFEEPTGWTIAFVAEADGQVIGMVRLEELTPDLIALDQVSVDPGHARQGVGRDLLRLAANAAKDQGYAAMTGTTFRDVVVNGPFYASLGCVEDPDPHPTMVERRRVEAAVGLDGLGPRIVLRASLQLSSIKSHSCSFP